jgi:hypothetical protein
MNLSRRGPLLLPSRGGRALKNLDDVMRSICSELGITEKVTPHDLRRTHGSTITKLRFGRSAMNRIPWASRRCLRSRSRSFSLNKSLRIFRIDARVRPIGSGVVRRIDILVGERKALGHGADRCRCAVTPAFTRHTSSNNLVRLAGLDPDWNGRGGPSGSGAVPEGQLVCAGKQINHRWTTAGQSQSDEALPVDFADVRYHAGALKRTSENSRDLLRRSGAAFVGVYLHERLFGCEQLSQGNWTRAEEKKEGSGAKTCYASFGHGV